MHNGIAKTDFQDDTPAPRTLIATDGNQNWILGTVSACTLEELASLVSSPTIQTLLNVRDALNLDGGPSSAFWIQVSSNKVIYARENTVVRNFLGIRKR